MNKNQLVITKIEIVMTERVTIRGNYCINIDLNPLNKKTYYVKNFVLYRIFQPGDIGL